MKRKNINGGRHSWVINLMACILAVVLSGIYIFTANILNKNLDTLSEHPYAVSATLFRLRRALSDSQIRISRLTMYNEKQDVGLVRASVREIHSQIGGDYQHIAQYYLGSAADLERLEVLLDEISEAEDRLIARAGSRMADENEKFIRGELTPRYDEFDQLTNSMILFTENTVRRLSASSSDMLLRTVTFTLIIAALMIILAIFYQRQMLMRLKDKDVYYRDFLFNALSENIDDVFMIYNVEIGEIEFVSSNSSRVIGIDSRKLESGGVHLEEYWESETEYDGYNLEQRIVREGTLLNPVTNTKVCMQIGGYPILEDGRAIRYIIKISDLTGVKKQQQIMRDALLNARQASQAKSDFLSRMSHEIRTPMNAIIGMTTIAATVLDRPERLEDCLSKISISSRHLLSLINDILDMSKIESGKMALTDEPFSLPELIDSVSTIFYFQSQEKGQNFEVYTNVEHELLIGDSLRLNQVLINLISNALKYTPSGGTIKLAVEELPVHQSRIARIRFVISDNGAGMSREFQKKLFLPFEQEKSSTSGGTGLGLAITKNLVLLANGSIHVESEPGKGSTFTVEIPFQVAGASFSIAYPPEQFDNLRVLVADDDRDTCEHTTIILSRLGIQAKWVLSGAEALKQVSLAYEAGVCFDVIFIDWKMPEMDGVETARLIRGVVGPETAIIIISAFDWTAIEHEARLAGVNAFISKPMFQSTIYNALAGLYRRRPAQANPPEKVEADFSGKRFLLVEDNDLNLEIGVELLTMTGAQVETAVNGREAVEKFLSAPAGYYDTVLMDIQMPEMDGYEACRTIRASSHPGAARVPIIAMTANAFSEDVAAAMRAGMSAHIAKPIDMDILYKTVTQQMRAAESR